jgi:hypothetical protein
MRCWEWQKAAVKLRDLPFLGYRSSATGKGRFSVHFCSILVMAGLAAAGPAAAGPARRGRLRRDRLRWGWLRRGRLRRSRLRRGIPESLQTSYEICRFLLSLVGDMRSPIVLTPPLPHSWLPYSEHESSIGKWAGRGRTSRLPNCQRRHLPFTLSQILPLNLYVRVPAEGNVGDRSRGVDIQPLLLIRSPAMKREV